MPAAVETVGVSDGLRESELVVTVVHTGLSNLGEKAEAVPSGVLKMI